MEKKHREGGPRGLLLLLLLPLPALFLPLLSVLVAQVDFTAVSTEVHQEILGTSYVVWARPPGRPRGVVLLFNGACRKAEEYWEGYGHSERHHACANGGSCSHHPAHGHAGSSCRPRPAC